MVLICQVACGGYHTLAVCAHDSMQQEQAEKQRGYKQKVMQLFSKPVTVDVPDSRQHSTGPNTAGSGGVTPLDRVSEGSLSLMAHGSNGMHASFVIRAFQCFIGMLQGSRVRDIGNSTLRMCHSTSLHVSQQTMCRRHERRVCRQVYCCISWFVTCDSAAASWRCRQVRSVA